MTDLFVQLPLSEDANARPLMLRLTPPAVITSMTYLISAVSKRDPVGRNPKRGVFAREGLLHLENELALGTAAQTGKPVVLGRKLAYVLTLFQCPSMRARPN